MDDLISRQAAIDIFDDYNIAVENGELEAYSRDRKRLCNLPTIQPQSTAGQLNDGARSTDLIDRQQAIDALDCINGTEEVLRSLPPAQPEAQWIPVGEKLPETEDFVLASLSGKYRNTTFEHACEIADYADGEWCVCAYPNMSAEKCAELIEAWMSLPTPYRKGAAT